MNSVLSKPCLILVVTCLNHQLCEETHPASITSVIRFGLVIMVFGPISVKLSYVKPM